MSQEAELGLRDRLAQLSGVKLLRGTKLSAELERLQRQLERLRDGHLRRGDLALASSSRGTRSARTRSTTSSGSSTTGSSCTATAAGWTTRRSSPGSARSDGRTIALVGHQKGRDLKERAIRNFGMAYPEGYRKAMRTMELAERHGFPLVTLVDTPGAYPGIAAEQHGQGGAIARSQMVMLRLGVPTVAVVIGEGGSGGAVAIAVADRVLMQENAIYSVISPEGCASILWRDAAQAKKAASAFKPDAAHCLELGVIDGIVPEPEGGAQSDHDARGDAHARGADRPSRRAGRRSRPTSSGARRRAKFRSMGVLASV